LKHQREQGYHAAVVEHWNPFAHIRQDLFNWIDIVAVHPQIAGVLGIQTTTASNVNARAIKARGNPALRAWYLAGGRLSIHGWKKVKNKWALYTAMDMALEDFDA
jgi:hypothetical protein